MTKIFQIIAVSCFAALVWIEPTFAQTTGEQASQTMQETLATLQGLLGVLLAFLNVLIWPLLSMIGGLMSNDLIFGPQVEDRLLLIWGQLRNLVNLIFVLALVAMAIYNVIGPGEESNYTIKKILPKFIIALVVINFTFVGAKVVLSAVNVLTTAVYALPNSVEAGFASVSSDQLASVNCPNIIQTYPENGICEDSSSFTPEAKSFFTSFSGDNVAYLMAMNLSSISDYLQVSALVLEEPSIQNVTVNIVISIVMYLMNVIAFIVLFFVLLARIVVLWFVIAVSPIVGIQIVFPEALASVGGDALNLQDLFVKHAIAPLIIGLGLTVGYLMLDAYYQTSAPSLGSSLQLGADFANAFSAGSSGLQQILVGFAAVAVIWIVTFAAADNTMASIVTSTIKSSLGQLGSQVAKFPLYAQWIPIPAGIDKDGSGTASLMNILNSPGQRLQDIENSGRQGLGAPTTNNPRIPEYRNYLRGSQTDNQSFNIAALRTLQNDTETQREVTASRFNTIVQAGVRDGSLNSTGANNARTILNEIVTASGLGENASFAAIMKTPEFTARSNDFFNALNNSGSTATDMSQTNLSALEGFSPPATGTTGGAGAGGAGAGGAGAGTPPAAPTPTPPAPTPTPPPPPATPTP